jgi:hypothetical protein
MGSLNPFSVIVGAFLGISLNFLLRLWQYKRDNWLNRIDWFCETLEQAADLATEYWCELGKETTEDDTRAHRLIGLQTRLDGLLATLSERFDNKDREMISELMVQVRDALTGGSFMSESATKDVNRARDAQVSVSDLIIAVRIAADCAMAPSTVFLRFLPARKYPISESDHL